MLCVTGTKGKSTTASLTGHLLIGLGYRCLVGGNIGVVPYDPAETSRPGLLDHRGVQLPGHRPALHAPGDRGDLAAPRPPGLARGSGAVLPGQAVAMHPARSRTNRGQRRQRPAQEARNAARAPGGVGQRARRPGRGLDGAPRPARPAQPAQRADRPPLPGRPRRARGPRRASAARGGARLPTAAQPADPDRHRRRGHRSSTTACPPTCCPPWPRWTRSPAGGSR